MKKCHCARQIVGIPILEHCIYQKCRITAPEYSQTRAGYCCTITMLYHTVAHTNVDL